MPCERIGVVRGKGNQVRNNRLCEDWDSMEYMACQGTERRSVWQKQNNFLKKGTNEQKRREGLV